MKTMALDWSESADCVPSNGRGLGLLWRAIVEWDKRINLGHLLTTVIMITGLFMWGSGISERLAVLETARVEQQSAQILRDKAATEAAVQLREEMRDLRSEVRALRETMQRVK